MQVRTTAKIKIRSTPEIVQTLNLYARGLQHCINVAWDNGIKNNIKLHPFVYQHLKRLGLQSQLCISCIKQASGMIKKAKNKPIIKNVSMRYNFPRSASIKNNILSLATIKGRQKIPFTIPDNFKKYFSWNIKESLLRIDKKGRTYFLFTFAKEVNIRSSNSQAKILGIDLGINNIAVTNNNTFFKGKETKRIKRKYAFLRRKLQAKGTKASKKLLKRISGKEQRFMAWVNHNISKTIVSQFTGDTIRMENLKGIRKRRRGKTINRWINNWSCYQLQSFIEYKANRQGISVEKVDPYLTSQICSNCEKLGSRSKGHFSCSHCGFSLNSDLNASRNIAKGKSYSLPANVNLPHLTCDDISARSLNVN